MGRREKPFLTNVTWRTNYYDVIKLHIGVISKTQKIKRATTPDNTKKN